MNRKSIIELLTEALYICDDTEYFNSIDETHCHSEAESLIYQLKSLDDDTEISENENNQISTDTEGTSI